MCFTILTELGEFWGHCWRRNWIMFWLKILQSQHWGTHRVLIDSWLLSVLSLSTEDVMLMLTLLLWMIPCPTFPWTILSGNTSCCDVSPILSIFPFRGADTDRNSSPHWDWGLSKRRRLLLRCHTNTYINLDLQEISQHLYLGTLLPAPPLPKIKK